METFYIFVFILISFVFLYLFTVVPVKLGNNKKKSNYYFNITCVVFVKIFVSTNQKFI